jgi:hypothetical protein
MSTTTKAGTHALSLSAVSRNFGGIRAVGGGPLFFFHPKTKKKKIKKKKTQKKKK